MPRSAVGLLFARTRKLVTVFGLVVGVGLLVVFFGAVELGAPSAAPGGTTISLVRLSTIAPGMLPVLILSSQLPELEAAASSALRRLETWSLVATFLAASLVTAAASVLATGPGTLPVTARALLAWFGLALISGRVLGWRFAWAGPCLVLCVLVYWGYDSAEGAFHWWEFTADGRAELPAWLLSVGLFAAGAASYWLTPWRTAGIRTWIGSVVGPATPRADEPPGLEQVERTSEVGVTDQSRTASSE